jgi:hypothetical protein
VPVPGLRPHDGVRGDRAGGETQAGETNEISAVHNAAIILAAVAKGYKVSDTM